MISHEDGDFMNAVSAIIRDPRGCPRGGSEITNPTSIHEDPCLTPGLIQWVKDMASS